MGKYNINVHVPGTCVKYCTNTSPLGEDKTYGWRPNITGLFVSKSNTNTPKGFGYNSYGTGALSLKAISGSGYTVGDSASSNYNQFGIGLNANSSNSVYTDSGKVYPASVALNFIIKA